MSFSSADVSRHRGWRAKFVRAKHARASPGSTAQPLPRSRASHDSAACPIPVRTSSSPSRTGATPELVGRAVAGLAVVGPGNTGLEPVGLPRLEPADHVADVETEVHQHRGGEDGREAVVAYEDQPLVLERRVAV